MYRFPSRWGLPIRTRAHAPRDGRYSCIGARQNRLHQRKRARGDTRRHSVDPTAQGVNE